MGNEIDQEEFVEQEQQAEGEAPATEGTEEAPSQEQTTQVAPQPAPVTRKGPPDVLPYERFQQENRARRAAEARAAALETELANARKSTQPATKRTEEHEFIAEAVKPLIEQMRGETQEALSYIDQVKDDRESERFWSNPQVDPDFKDRVEELFSAAKEEARARGQRLAFTRRDIYVYELGLKSEATAAEARAQASNTRAQAGVQRAQLAQVNRIAKVEAGGTAQKNAPKSLDKMTPKERAKFLEDEFGDQPI